jgi:thiol-disulfide isomerase/thioredoxin
MLKNIFLVIVLILIGNSLISASEKKVLVEIFTNSHCGLCPSAHTALDNYLGTANANKIEFVYYHMVFPYSNDQLNNHNPSDADAKNSFYGPFGGTPVAFFDGKAPGASYGGWKSKLDVLVQEESGFNISLSGTKSDNDFTVLANIEQTENAAFSDLTINYVVVEDVYYKGGNNISDHKNVMRKIVNPQGDSFIINYNESKNLETTINNNSVWDLNQVKVVVFIQNKSTKEILQSQSISYSEFGVTSIENEKVLANSFRLEQNYPNPFNPTTTISYTLPSNQYVTLSIFDVLGNEVDLLFDGTKPAGNHNITFDASNFSNGVYYYQLKAGNLIQTKKMILLK